MPQIFAKMSSRTTSRGDVVHGVLDSNERLLELSSSRPKGKFDANAGIKLFWSKIKFVAYPEATVCRHESHVIVMSYYGVKPDTEEAAQFMRTYFRQIVNGLNVRRNNSAKGTRKLFLGKWHWVMLWFCLWSAHLMIVFLFALDVIKKPGIKKPGVEFPGFDRIKLGCKDREAFEFLLRHLMKEWW
jgi:hypothetical protein